MNEAAKTATFHSMDQYQSFPCLHSHPSLSSWQLQA